MTELDKFYINYEEPTKGLFLALKEIILKQDKNIINSWKYKMPFFSYKGKMFCYLWYHKVHQQPYLGLVEGNRFNESFLIQEKRSRMKIMLLDPNKDLPIDTIKKVLKKAINFYTSGEIKIKE